MTTTAGSAESEEASRMTTLRETEDALPGSPGYAESTAVFNLAAPVRPGAAVTVRTTGQLRRHLGRAVADGRPVQVHSTGHAAATLRPMPEALLIRTRMAGGVRVDPAKRSAWIPAGTVWSDVVRATAGYGLAAPHGSSGLVGVVGYLLRGGVSSYGRHTGLAANSVRGIDLMTADGEVRRVDPQTDAELFWAMRGGGGGFGVVVGIEIGLHPITQIVSGTAAWPARHADRLLGAWLRWAKNAPDAATTSFRLMRLPPVEEVPAVLRMRRVVCMDGVVVGTQTGGHTAARRHAQELLEPLRQIADPIFDTWRSTTPAAAQQTHIDPTTPCPLVGDHMLLGDLDPDGAAAYLSAGSDNSPLANAELRQLGGALAVPDPQGGAMSHIDAPFAFLGAGAPLGGVTVAEIEGCCAGLRTALRPWDTGRTAPSFVAHRDQPQSHLGPEQIRRVDSVRVRVDPAGVFRGDIAPGSSVLR